MNFIIPSMNRKASTYVNEFGLLDLFVRMDHHVNRNRLSGEDSDNF